MCRIVVNWDPAKLHPKDLGLSNPLRREGLSMSIINYAKLQGT